MSKKIAPGKWDPWLRVAAKNWAKFAGVAMIAFGMAIGLTLGRALIMSDREVSMWLAALVGTLTFGPVVIGALAVFPDVLTPLAYRALDEIDRKRQGVPGDEGSS